MTLISTQIKNPIPGKPSYESLISDVDHLKSKSTKAPAEWTKFLETLDRIINLKVAQDIQSLEPAQNGWKAALKDVAQRLLPANQLLAYTTYPQGSDCGLDIGKLTEEAGLDATTLHEKNIFEALVNRNYVHRMIEGLASSNGDQAIKYAAKLIKLDGLTNLLAMNNKPMTSFLEEQINNGEIRQSLEITTNQPSRQDVAAALVLASSMLEKTPAKNWTEPNKIALAKYQELIEGSDTNIMALDPALNQSQVKQAPPPDMLIDIIGKNPQIFSQMRFITGRSFVKKLPSIGAGAVYYNLTRSIPLNGNTLFAFHRDLGNLQDSRLKALAEYAMLVKSSDTRENYQGQVEYIADVLSKAPNTAAYQHIITQLAYPAQDTEANPADKLREGLKNNGTSMDQFTRRINIGDDISIQKIRPRQGNRVLLISSKSGYLELTQSFLENLRNTATEKTAEANELLDNYIKAIKLLTQYDQSPEKIANEVIAAIGYSRCPEFIRNHNFSYGTKNNAEAIIEKQRGYVRINPGDTKEIDSLARSLAGRHDATLTKEIQSLMYRLLILKHKQGQSLSSPALDGLWAPHTHLENLVFATRQHYPHEFTELTDQQYQDLLIHELRYLLDSRKKALWPDMQEDANQHVHAERLAWTVKAHSQTTSPEPDAGQPTIKAKINALLEDDNFNKKGIEEQITDLTAMVK